jgi:DNA-binding SARP family transcriptional activator
MPRTEHARATVRLLGPINVEGPDGPVPVGGPRTQRMIAALALRANRPVPVAFLVDAVWGARPPRTCRDQIHNGMVRLRRLLASAGDVLVSRLGDGYRLDIDPDRVDVNLFQADLARARALGAAGDAAGAATRLRRALDHWYGNALDGLADGTLAGDAVRLEELRISAYEELFSHELTLGDGAAAVGEIAALARRHPLRERLVLQLMTGLRRCGRSAEALQVFRDHRRRMVDELGVEPDRSLQDLEADILRNGSAPSHIDAGGRAELAALLARLAELTREVDAVARRLAAQDAARTSQRPGGVSAA